MNRPHIVVRQAIHRAARLEASDLELNQTAAGGAEPDLSIRVFMNPPEADRTIPGGDTREAFVLEPVQSFANGADPERAVPIFGDRGDLDRVHAFAQRRRS